MAASKRLLGMGWKPPADLVKNLATCVCSLKSCIWGPVNGLSVAPLNELLGNEEDPAAPLAPFIPLPPFPPPTPLLPLTPIPPMPPIVFMPPVFMLPVFIPPEFILPGFILGSALTCVVEYADAGVFTPAWEPGNPPIELAPGPSDNRLPIGPPMYEFVC